MLKSFRILAGNGVEKKTWSQKHKSAYGSWVVIHSLDQCILSSLKILASERAGLSGKNL